MPRQARINVPGLFHHVMARGIEGREIFRDEADRENFLARLSDVLSAADVVSIGTLVTFVTWGSQQSSQEQGRW